MSSAFKNKRLQKELAKITEALPPGITLVSAPDLQTWQLDLAILDAAHPLYAGQTFRISLRFGDKYPIEAPEVFFVASSAPPARAVPLHPHIYSNGMVCLDLLGSGWSPVQNAESIAVSLQSMLTGNVRGERPEGDLEFCKRYTPGRSKGIGFLYDDDKV